MATPLVALVCLAVIQDSNQANAQELFQPTPIPLASWQLEAARVAETRPHYWEDALRHSVYLALVRDRIDGLIARDARHDRATDSDLWDGIRAAPFDRAPRDDRPIFGDIAILASGRLVEGAHGIRFLEDARGRCAGCPDFFGFNPECGAPACRNRDAVTADWAVKRVRHREPEGAPAPYRYELTFSVMTARGAPHPARTFTLREAPVAEGARVQRTHWVHGNLDDHRATEVSREPDRRMFFSLDEDVERPRSPSWGPAGAFPFPLKAKVTPSDSFYQKKMAFYPWKQPPKIMYQRPAIVPSSVPQQHYLDVDGIGVVSVPHEDPKPKPAKPFAAAATKGPAAAPPPAPTKLADAKSTAAATSRPAYSSAPLRYGIIMDNRPPAYGVTDSAPAGRPKVKPTYYNKQGRPIDFRPSPQVIEMQYSEQMTDPWVIRSPGGSTNLTVVSGENFVNVTHLSQPSTTTNRPEKASEATLETQTHTHYQATSSDVTTTTGAPNSIIEELESGISWTNLFTPITRSPAYDTLRKTTKKPRTSPVTTEKPTTTTTQRIVEITAPPTTTTAKPRPTTTQAAKSTKIPKLFKNISRPTTTTTTTRPTTNREVKIVSPHTTTPTTTPTTVKTVSKIPEETSTTAVPSNKRNRYRQSSIMLKGIVLKGFKKPAPVKLTKSSSKAPYKWLTRRTTSKFQGYYSTPSTTTTMAKYESNIETNPKEDNNDTIAEKQPEDSMSEATSLNETTVKENLIEETLEDKSEPTTTPVPISPLEYSIQKNKTLSLLESKPRIRPLIFSVKTNTGKISNKTHNTTIAANPVNIKNNTKCKNRRKHGRKHMTTEEPAPETTLEPLTKKTLVTSISLKIGNKTEDYIEPTVESTVDMVSKLLLGGKTDASLNTEPEMSTTVDTEIEHATEEFKIPDLSSLFDWV